MGHHLYDENKRLKAENERPRAQVNERRDIGERKDAGEELFDAFLSFVRGEAIVWIEPGGNVPGSLMVRFSKPSPRGEK